MERVDKDIAQLTVFNAGKGGDGNGDIEEEEDYGHEDDENVDSNNAAPLRSQTTSKKNNTLP